MPGAQSMGWIMTSVLGIVGSIVGGFVSSLIWKSPDGKFHPAGWILSILGAARRAVGVHAVRRVNEAFLCDAVRTPIGRYGGVLSSVRTDDLGAVPIRALIERNPAVDWSAVDDVIYGCANQAGEDNRNVGRMALLLAGLPTDVPGTTVNRLCGSSLDAVAMAARAIKCGEMSLVIAGGVESMSRAPFVIAKADSAFSRAAKIEDTTIGWRFVNPAMKAKYGIDTMPETAENVAAEFGVGRADQDAFALRSQARAAAAIAAGRLGQEIVPVTLPAKKGDPRSSRATSIRAKRRWKRWPSSRASSVRTVRSPRATRPASTMAVARRCSPPPTPPAAMVSRRRRGWLPRRSRASRRASWASGRRPRYARCWRRRSSRSPIWTSSN